MKAAKIKRDENLLIRLTDNEKKVLQHEANIQGLTTSQFIRNLTLLPFKEKKDIELYYNILKTIMERQEIKATKLDDHLLEQILLNDDNNVFSIIEHYGLTNNEVKLIVQEWYLSIEEILQDENGNDLEEIVDINF